MANTLPSAGSEDATAASESVAHTLAPNPGEGNGDPTVATVATSPATFKVGSAHAAVLMGLLQKVPRSGAEMAADRMRILGEAHLSLGQALELVSLAKPKTLGSLFKGERIGIDSKDYVVLRWLVALGSEAAGMLPLDAMHSADAGTFHSNLRRAAADYAAAVERLKKRISRANAAEKALHTAELGQLEQALPSTKFFAAPYLPVKYRVASEAVAAAAATGIAIAAADPLAIAVRERVLHATTKPPTVAAAAVDAPAVDAPAVDQSNGKPTLEQAEIERLQADLDAEFDRHDATATQSDTYKQTIARLEKENERSKKFGHTMAFSASKWRQKHDLLAAKYKRAVASWETQLEVAQQNAKKAAVKHCREVERLYFDMADLKSNLTASWANEEGLKQRLRSETTTTPLRVALGQCEEQRTKVTELEGRHISVGMELARLRALVAAQPAAEQRSQTSRQLRGAFDAALTELEQMKAAMSSPAVDGETAAGVQPLQPGPKQPYDPFVAEMLRQIVSYGKVPKHNVPAVMALCHAAITREVPDFTSLTSASHVDEAFAKLGALDAEDRAAANATDRHSFAVASDI